jgi:hypothetical protein
MSKQGFLGLTDTESSLAQFDELDSVNVHEDEW